MLNTIWQFSTTHTFKFGRGARHLVFEQLRRHAVLRPLVVTDPNVAGIAGVATLLGELRASFQLAVFDQGEAEPSLAVATAACGAASEHQADAIVAIGGGSNLDVGKIVAIVGRHGGSPTDYFGFDRVPGPVLPLFALPTTAGTGSEVSHSAVLTDVAQRIKVSTLSPWLRPTCAVVDPELTDDCPPRITAHSGIDALVHAIEAYTARDFSQMVGVDPQARAYEGSYPLTQLLAAEAIRLIGRSLVHACHDPQHQAARDDMALAATLAGMAFSNSGVAVVHALEYPIGALTHCSHGEGNGLLLPHVMRYNLPSCSQSLAAIAGYLGIDVAALTPLEAAEKCLERVESLVEAVGIRRRLRELGLAHDSLSEVAAKAFEIKRLMDVNPRQPSLADLESILQAAY